MSAVELLHQLRDGGVILTLAGDHLRCEGPPEADYRQVRAALKQHAPALIRRLQDEAQAQAAADKVGVMMLYWQEHVHEWPDEKYQRRRDLLLAWMDHLDAALRHTGEPLEAYGWAVGPVGEWRRLGE